MAAGAAPADRRLDAHCVVAVLLSFITVACASGSRPATLAGAAAETSLPSPDFPEGPGRDRFLAVCGRCHSPRFVLRRPYGEDQWVKVIHRMNGHGAKVSPEDRSEILGYLLSRQE
jgi:mono/diheme cytochrome c family protein